MKFYNPDKLFIGRAGYAINVIRNNEPYIKFEEKEFIIAKQDLILSSDYYYYDTITNRKYIDFDNVFCVSGDLAILKPMCLSLFIQNNEHLVTQIDSLKKMMNKILKGKKISDKEIKQFIILLNTKTETKNKDIKNNKINNEDNKPKENIDLSFSSILTNKKFNREPAIGRDNELKELIITLAQEKKSPILIGESGTGKTTIVDELAYKIQKDEVPNFLKNQKIIEIDLTSLLSGTRYAGTLEEKVTKIIDITVKEGAILFIDEIHTLYGAGSHNNSDYDVAGMIKQAIDRKGLKVIGTTTIDEYDKYFSNDALKRRFEKIIVKEPTDEVLYKIINKVFNDYSKSNNIKLLNNMDNIVYLLINLTNSKNRLWNDKVCNPDLVIGIIDRIFADAKVNDQNELTIYNIIYGIKSCNRIDDFIKEDTINKLAIEKEHNIEKPKIIQLKR